jgi:hypothetical protein
LKFDSGEEYLMEMTLLFAWRLIAALFLGAIVGLERQWAPTYGIHSEDLKSTIEHSFGLKSLRQEDRIPLKQWT